MSPRASHRRRRRRRKKERDHLKKCVSQRMRVCVCVLVCVKESPGSRKKEVSAAPDRGCGCPPLRLRVAEDPRVRRTDPMCVWHRLGVINVFVRPPSLHSRLTPPSTELKSGKSARRKEKKKKTLIWKGKKKCLLVWLIGWLVRWLAALIWIGLIGLIGIGKGAPLPSSLCLNPEENRTFFLIIQKGY